ncbi:HelD family protein [Luteococcus sp. Sow4_B9]|uniref:HelD family protein n=1 Tax=Luteococcus sp. Sow4_B9 TaxID=3438792 RepID=UPI003F97AAE7
MTTRSETVLQEERAHLAKSHRALARMREESADWQQAVAGDSVSTAYLRQMLFRRMESLEKDPDTPLFFGRLDYRRSAGAEVDEVCHIGRRHVIAEAGGDPLVIDWRAPLSLPFYRAHAGDPMHCTLRRRFGFQHGQMTAYEDEQLDQTPSGSVSALLEAEIERPRTGPMRDIVATIQPDQDVLVRADLSTSLAVQGAPGTGKTAVGLHRAAYLLYAHRETLTRRGVLVIGPNANFLRYIADVLPALGEVDARQETIDSLVATHTGLTCKGVDEPARAVLLGDARMARVASRAVWSHVREPERTLEVPMGVRVWRVLPHHLADAVRQVRTREVRYTAGREMLPQRLAHQVLLRMEVSGAVTDDRVQNKVARGKDVKAMVNEIWPALTVPKLTHRLLTDRSFLAACAEGILTEQEQDLLIGPKPARTPGAQKWTPAEIVLADEVADLLLRTPSLGHVIIDEAQDLSAMQLRAAGRRASTGSVTLLGDLAQATTPWATTSWQESLAHIGHPEATVRELVEGFRVPGAVIDYAAQLLPSIAAQLTPPRSIRHDRGELIVRPCEDLLTEVVTHTRALLAKEGTVGVIVADNQAEAIREALVSAGELVAIPDEAPVREALPEPGPSSRLEVVPAGLTKGLEFDHVLLVEPAGIVAGEPDRTTGLRRLYVCLTRAVTSLIILHHDDVPAELALSDGPTMS